MTKFQISSSKSQYQKSNWSLVIGYWLLLFVTCFCLLASDEPSKPTSSSGKLDASVNKLISQYGLTQAKIGIKVVRLSDNKTVYEQNADTPLIPASNVKLFTTGTALCLLGPDFLYETTLYRLGPIRDNTLKGNLIIKSNGDPNISGRFHNDNPTAVFEEWGKILRSLRVRKIKGDIIIDDTAFDRHYLMPSWPSNQLSYWYCAPVSGVSFNDNCVDITVYSDKDTGEIKYRLEPPTKYVTIINRCQSETKKSRHAIDITRESGTNNITIRGKFWMYAEPYTESITIKNPGLYFGTVLKETLVYKKGIPVFGRVVLADKTYEPKEDHLVKLASIKTDLLTTITVTNKKSQNFYAEQILKTLGYSFKGKGTFANGIAVIKKFLVEKVKMPMTGLQLVDGSGLSRGNRISPTQVISLLVYLDQSEWSKQFRKTLPVNGQDGGLKSRLKGSNHRGRVFAKTGYIRKVLALSGYLKNNPNEYAFSIIINDFPDPDRARQFQDELLKILLKPH